MRARTDGTRTRNLKWNSSRMVARKPAWWTPRKHKKRGLIGQGWISRPEKEEFKPSYTSPLISIYISFVTWIANNTPLPQHRVYFPKSNFQLKKGEGTYAPSLSKWRCGIIMLSYPPQKRPVRQFGFTPEKLTVSTPRRGNFIFQPFSWGEKEQSWKIVSAMGTHNLHF